MKKNACIPQKLSKAVLAAILFAGAIGFFITGLTILPVVGFIPAIPFVIFAVFFTKQHLNERCEIDLA